MACIRAIELMVAFSLAALAAAQSAEETAHEIEAMLIAPCCWSQPVSQHYSEAADKIRREVRELLAAGKSKQQILDYYESVYGERILASPRPHGFNLLVYFVPPAILLIGATSLAIFLKKWTTRLPDEQEFNTASGPLDERYASRVESELRELQ